ncbi:hypothetical protein Taro_018114 [Colocasia esculenta]|uniref:Uncharacterized protein n=1 Tax=Colocasia esculenta TaxID=4460 RepID=A0A843USZ3_COLES|nr:hypothetical protein [Colocasia esculenta]
MPTSELAFSMSTPKSAFSMPTPKSAFPMLTASLKTPTRRAETPLFLTPKPPLFSSSPYCSRTSSRRRLARRASSPRWTPPPPPSHPPHPDAAGSSLTSPQPGRRLLPHLPHPDAIFTTSPPPSPPPHPPGHPTHPSPTPSARRDQEPDMTSSNISLMCYYDGVLRIEDHKPQYEGGIVRILRVKKDTTLTEMMRKLYILTKYDERHIKIGITYKWSTSIGEYIAVRVEDDETVESMFDLYHSHVSTIQLYLEKEDVDNISIQGNDEVQTHGHIDDNLHTQHYEYQQPSGLFTRMLNDDVDSTGFYSANERDVRHHVTEEHVVKEDEEDEIDSQNDIDDNENMDEGDEEPLFDISRVNNTEIEYEQDPPDIFTSDQWIDEAMLNNSHEGIDVPCTLEGMTEIDQLPGLVDNSVLYAQEGHRSQLVYIGQMQDLQSHVQACQMHSHHSL